MTLYAFKNKIPQIHDSVFIAPGVHIVGDVHIGSQSSVWFNTVLRGDLDQIRVGEGTNIQDLCLGHADEGIPLHIGNGVTIGHRGVIHGCTIQDGCLIGMGAVLMNHAVIGKGSVVAAGTVILEKTVIPAYSLVTGVPGRIKKTYDSAEAIEEDIQTMSEFYMKNALEFSTGELFYKIHNRQTKENIYGKA